MKTYVTVIRDRITELSRNRKVSFTGAEMLMLACRMAGGKSLNIQQLACITDMEHGHIRAYSELSHPEYARITGRTDSNLFDVVAKIADMGKPITRPDLRTKEEITVSEFLFSDVE